MDDDDLERSVGTALALFRRTLRAEDLAIFDKRITAEEPLTLQQLADEMNVSREQVRRVEAAMMQRLRDFLGPRPAA